MSANRRQMETFAPERLSEPRRVAVAAGGAIALLGAIGSLDLLVPSLPLAVFSLEGEHTVPAAFSAALLLGVGVLAWRLSDAQTPAPDRRFTWWRFLAVFFAFMALDELFAIHEHLSAPVTGVSWQFFYAPIALLASVAWLVVLPRLPAGPARGMWLGGAAAWFVSQVIEAVQWDGSRLVYEWTFVPEETLEMGGSLLWGLSLLLALREMRARSEGMERDEPETAAVPPAQAARQRPSRRPRRARGPDRTGQPSGTPTSRTPGSR